MTRVGLGTVCLALLSLSTACGSDSGGSEGSGATGGTGGSGASGGGGAGGSSGQVTLPPEEERCGSKLFEISEDPGERGPWPVGARTLDVGGVTTEIWYPAEYASERGQESVVYDLRNWLPDAEQGKIPDEDNPWQACDCYRDLPLDTGRGPYPVLIFIHGTAAFRTQSLSQMTHWASRGFIVLSQDHQGLYLGDLLQFKFGADLPGDTSALLSALSTGSAGLDFLGDRADLTRIGMAGHSAGGGGIAGFGQTAGVKVLIPMASGGVDPAPESTLIMGALDDGVVAFSRQSDAYAAAPPKKRLVGLGNAGHLAFSDLCGLTNTQGQDLVAVAQAYNITNANLATMLWDGCADGQLAQTSATEVVNFATTAAFEELLQCSASAGQALSGIQATFTAVSQYEEQLN
ncbi:MAG: hypothetical protein H6718_16895 [Polyangiaceae bacterium]|nr:hypothetical protein [Polyangiaceae bacterium]